MVYLKLLVFYMWIMYNFVLSEDSFTLSNTDVSYCTLRMNRSSSFGCVSPTVNVIGEVILIITTDQFEAEVAKDTQDSVVLVIPTFIFIQKDLMMIVLQNIRIVGLIVLTYDNHTNDENVKFFTELPNCLNDGQQNCNVKGHNIYTLGYYYFHWNIPLILLKNMQLEYEKIKICVNNNHHESKLNEKCIVKIINYYPNLTSTHCDYMKNSWQSYFWLVYNYEYCKPFNGYNIYVTFNNVNYYNNKSIILIYTKTDSMSMFDTGAFGTADLHPTLAAMIYIANVFKEAAEANYIDEHSDILMAFVDNYDIDQLGTIKLIFDLKRGRVSNSKQNITFGNIKFVIFIEELFNQYESLLFSMFYCKDNILCEEFKKVLREYTILYEIHLKISIMEDSSVALSLWESLGIPVIEIRAYKLTTNLFRFSYLDNHISLYISFLDNIAKSIAFTLLKMVQSKNKKYPYNTSFLGFTSQELSTCFIDIHCRTLKKILGPKERTLYEVFAKQFVAQSFIDEVISAKKGMYLNRLSAFVLKLLVIFLSQSNSSIDECQAFKKVRDFETTVNDILFCFQTKVQLESNFRATQLQNIYRHLTNQSLPKWMRVSIYKRQSITFYIARDKSILNILVVLYIIVFVLTLVVSIFVYTSKTLLISEE